jgi:hypothetical protein
MGVKLISILFFLESVALILAAVIGHFRPELRLSANAFISQRVPLIQAFELDQWGVKLAPLFAIFSSVEGLGIWFLKRWARSFVLWDLVNRLCGGAIAAAMLWGPDRNMLSSIISKPHFAIGVVVNILIVFFLLDPDAKRAFGMKSDESEDWLVI